MSAHEMECCDAVELELDRVLSRFTTGKQLSSFTLANIIENIESLRKELAVGPEKLTPLQREIIKDCMTKIKQTIHSISSQHRDLHSCVSKVGKAIDKNFTSDYAHIARNLEDEDKITLLNEVICEHFLRQGRLGVAEALIREGKLQLTDAATKPFIEMHEIVDGLKSKDLQPAMRWAERHREQLRLVNSTLEFCLLKMQFLLILSEGPHSRWRALHFAKLFQPFSGRHSQDIQQLMGCFLFHDRGLENSPYASLVSPLAWEALTEQFSRDACSLLGLPLDSPLSISLNAGSKAIGPLLHITAVMLQRQLTSAWSAKEELPVEIDLGQDTRFHSIFACPILRQHTTENNPPMRLVCGHVISKDALNKLSNGAKLKCPYCPVEQAVGDAVRIHL